MRMDKFTTKAQEALQRAQEIASGKGQQQVDALHLLKALLTQEESLVRGILEKLNVNFDSLAKEVETAIAGLPTVVISMGGIAQIFLTQDLGRVLEQSIKEAVKLKDEFVSREHLLLALLLTDCQSSGILKEHKINKDKLLKVLKVIRGNQKVTDKNPEGKYQAIEKYTINLTQQAKQEKLDPVIGRDQEIRRLMQVLSRRTKNNPVLIGDPGVGKTALVEGLAQRIADGKVPPSLRDMSIVLLDVASIMAGSRMRGDVEEKVMNIVSEVVESSNTILFIDEIHNILSSGIPGSSSDIASILKPALLKDEFRCIGATTTEDYSIYIEEDNALARRFQPIKLEEASVKDTLEILKNIKVILETHHNINISNDAMEVATKLSDRYVSNRYLPDKAIDLLDEACATKRMDIEGSFQELSNLINRLRTVENAKKQQISKGNMGKAEELNRKEEELEEKIEKLEKECEASKRKMDNSVNVNDVRAVVSDWTGIPLNTLGSKERNALLKLDKELSRVVVGQDEAVEAVSNAIKRARTGISDENRPWASFLFLGPTGVGKSELAKALTKELFGSENRLIQIDMSELMESHSVSKLIGSPPGYVGYREGGRLTEEVRRNPHSVILFDEIEKAHQDVLNLLLQILEDGHLTDGKGRTVNFKNTIVILTSNIGAEEIGKDKILGFVGSSKKSENDLNNAYDSMKESLLLELKNTLRPELINRLDDIVIFRALDRRDARKIVKLLVKELNERLEDQGIRVKLGPKLITHIVNEGFSEEYGARPLRRVIQDTVENVLAEYLLAKGIEDEKDIKELKLNFEDDEVIVV